MGFEEIQGGKDHEQCGHSDQNNSGRPADDILKFIINMLSHDFRIVDHQLHRDQDHRQKHGIDILGP